MTRLSLLSIALCSFILFTSNRIGRGKAAGPATTSPGEQGQFCGSFGCHFSNSFDPQVQLSLLRDDGVVVDEYKSGFNYTVQLIINHTGFPAGYGFQMVALRDEDNSPVNNFTNLPAGTHEINLMGRQYVEHSQILMNDTILIDWIAPSQDLGSISFYAAGNAVNGNGASSGDGADTTHISIKEKQTLSINDLDLEAQVNVYPNPALDMINVSGKRDFKNIELWNLEGRRILQTQDSEISLQELSSGIYLIKVNYTEGTAVKKLIKI